MVQTRRFRVARVGLYYAVLFLAVLIGATSRQLNLLMLVGCILGGPLVISLVYGRWALRMLAAERRLPTHLHAGERLRVDVSVKNLRRRLPQWAVRVDDTVEHYADGESASVGVFFPSLPAGAARQGSYEGELPRRGRYEFGPLRVSTRFPLGLIRHEVEIDDRQELLVHPKLGRLNPGWVKMIREHETGTQHMTRRGLLEADFYGLREWRPGDSRRWIHWRTSARRGSLVVRQFEQRRSQNLAILLDLWQPEQPTERDRQRVETAISFVATLLAEICRQSGAQIHLEIAAEQSLSISGSGSPVFLREQMDTLALLAPHQESAWPARLGHALALVTAATPTLVVGTRPLNRDALRRAAAERQTPIDGRRLLEINAGGEEFSSFYHDAPRSFVEAALN